MVSQYSKPLPKITPLNAPFWKYAKGGELRFQHCNACGSWVYPISPVCQRCGSEDLEWKPVSGRGIVTSWVTYHKAFEESFKGDLPYTVIQVDLDEGFRLISNFVDADTEPAYRMRVSADFVPVTDEISLIKFKPSA